MVPHVAEDLPPSTTGKYPSIYEIYWTGWGVKVRLTNLCLPQHVLFLIGIVLYAVGSPFESKAGPWYKGKPGYIFLAALAGLVLAVLFAGNVSNLFCW